MKCVELIKNHLEYEARVASQCALKSRLRDEENARLGALDAVPTQNRNLARYRPQQSHRGMQCHAHAFGAWHDLEEFAPTDPTVLTHQGEEFALRECDLLKGTCRAHEKLSADVLRLRPIPA